MKNKVISDAVKMPENLMGTSSTARLLYTIRLTRNTSNTIKHTNFSQSPDEKATSCQSRLKYQLHLRSFPMANDGFFAFSVNSSLEDFNESLVEVATQYVR